MNVLVAFLPRRKAAGRDLSWSQQPVFCPASAGGFAGTLPALFRGEFPHAGSPTLTSDGGEELAHTLRGFAHNHECTRLAGIWQAGYACYA
jgi:hypothetical protein